MMNKQPLNELHRNISITAKVRYRAAERLNSHHRLSQWVVTFASVALIAIPLLQAMGINLRYNQELLDSMEVFLAVLVLVYSLLLGNEGYSSKAEKMLNCGLELGRLNNEIYPYLDQQFEQEIYEKFLREYYNILEKYPNHDSIDYEFYRISKKHEYYKDVKWHLFLLSYMHVKFKYYVSYWHYIAVMLGVVAALFVVFKA